MIGWVHRVVGWMGSVSPGDRPLPGPGRGVWVRVGRLVPWSRRRHGSQEGAASGLAPRRAGVNGSSCCRRLKDPICQPTPRGWPCERGGALLAQLTPLVFRVTPVPSLVALGWEKGGSWCCMRAWSFGSPVVFSAESMAPFSGTAWGPWEGSGCMA